MALRMFWRCEGTTLDGTHDYSIGDTTATAQNSPAINATQVKVGSNSFDFTSSDAQYRFDNTAGANQIVDRLVGAMGGWVRMSTLGYETPVFACLGSGFQYNINVYTRSATGDFGLSVNVDGGSPVYLPTTIGTIVVDTWYFVVGRWDQPNNSRAIEVYDSSLTLLQKVEDTSTAFTAPVDLNSDSGLRLGGATGYMDNVFVADTYNEAIQTYANITSYTEYGAGGATPAGRLIVPRPGTFGMGGMPGLRR